MQCHHYKHSIYLEGKKMGKYSKIRKGKKITCVPHTQQLCGDRNFLSCLSEHACDFNSVK